MALLTEESAAALSGSDYPHRVVLAKGNLHLFLRHAVNAQLPPHVIWLDATANPYLYRRITGWQIETVAPRVKLQGTVHQVWDSANTKSSLIADKQPTLKTDKLKAQIRQIIARYAYRRPAVISFQALRDSWENVEHGHFYASRGTNRFEDCDALIVAGTPQPSTADLVRTARMLFADRMEPFRTEWTARDIPFNYRAPDGSGFSFLASGFWGDPDLEALLWQVREAEIIQSAHRVRPIRTPKDIWLLTNLPIADLPPTHLLTVRELFGAPIGVDPYIWPQVLAVADAAHDLRQGLTPDDLMDRLGCKHSAANKYIDMLVEQFPERWTYGIVPRISGKGGRPRKSATPLYRREVFPLLLY